MHSPSTHQDFETRQVPDFSSARAVARLTRFLTNTACFRAIQLPRRPPPHGQPWAAMDASMRFASATKIEGHKSWANANYDAENDDDDDVNPIGRNTMKWQSQQIVEKGQHVPRRNNSQSVLSPGGHSKHPSSMPPPHQQRHNHNPLAPLPNGTGGQVNRAKWKITDDMMNQSWGKPATPTQRPPGRSHQTPTSPYPASAAAAPPLPLRCAPRPSPTPPALPACRHRAAKHVAQVTARPAQTSMTIRWRDDLMIWHRASHRVGPVVPWLRACGSPEAMGVILSRDPTPARGRVCVRGVYVCVL